MTFTYPMLKYPNHRNKRGNLNNVHRFKQIYDAENEERETAFRSVTIDELAMRSSHKSGSVVAGLTNSQTNPPRDRPSPNDRSSSTSRMARHCPAGNPPVVASGGHCYRRDLAPVAPFPQKRHYKRLHPRRAQQQREQIVDAAERIREAASPTTRRRTA